MNISVRYMRDFNRTYRCTLYLRRKVTMVFAAVGVLVLLAAFLPSRSSQAATVVLAVMGVIFLVEVPFLTWLTVIRNWNALKRLIRGTGRAGPEMRNCGLSPEVGTTVSPTA